MDETEDSGRGNGDIHQIFQKIIHFGSPIGSKFGDKHGSEENTK